MNPILTAASVAKLKPGNKPIEVPDGGMPGLRLIIYPSGRRSFIMRYIGTHGRHVKLTLGGADVTGAADRADPIIGSHLTLAEARRLAVKVKEDRGQGRNPKPAKAMTFANAAAAYVRDHASNRLKNWRYISTLLGLDPDTGLPRPSGLAAAWQKRGVAEITADDIHLAVQANLRTCHMLPTLAGMFRWLMDQRIVKDNPTVGVRGTPPNPARRRVLDDDELRVLWQAATAMGYPYGHLVRFLLVTGARRQEGGGMRRTELKGSKWTLPAERAKNGEEHTITLPTLAMEIIADCGDGEWVFSKTGQRPLNNNFSRNKDELDARMAQLSDQPIPPWVIHDLRRTFATGMARAGAAIHVTERALNHISGSFSGIVSVYQRHSYEPEVAAALEAWSQLLLRIIEPTNVVPMRA